MIKTKTAWNDNITALVTQLAAAVANAQLELNNEFEALKAKGETLQVANPSIVLPWDTATLPTDQRRYQVRNAKDAVLKYLSAHKAMTSGELVAAVLKSGLSYPANTIQQTLSNMKKEPDYRDESGYRLEFDYNGTYTYWKTRK